MTVSVPTITATGWRLWNLILGRDLYPQRLTRGVLVNIGEDGLPVADRDKMVHADELAIILSQHSDQPLAFHLCTRLGDSAFPGLVERLCGHYPALSGQVVQLNKRIDDDSAERLLAIKSRLGLRVILQHYNLLSATPGSPQLALTDQVLVDVGHGKGRNAISLAGRNLALVERILAITDAPIGLAGRLSAEAVDDLAESLPMLRALTSRPMALDAESQLRTRGNLDLEKTGAFAAACVAALDGVAV